MSSSATKPEVGPRHRDLRAFAAVAFALLTLPMVPMLMCCAQAGATPPATPGLKAQAAAISHVAHSKAKAGDFVLAAQLYEQAYKTDPSVPGYAFSAARCLHKAGRLDAAEAAYYRLLGTLKGDDKLAMATRARLAEVRSARRDRSAADRLAADKQAAATKEAAAKAQAAKDLAAQDRAAKDRPAPPTPAAAVAGARPHAASPLNPNAAGKPDSKSTHGGAREAVSVDKAAPRSWLAPGSALAAGAVAGVVGALLVRSAWTDGDALQTEIDNSRDQQGRVTLDREALLSRQQSLNMRLGAGFGVAAAGVAGLALGAWWLLDDDDRVALSPTANGARLRVRF